MQKSINGLSLVQNSLVESEFDKDVWDLKSIGVEISPYASSKTIGFYRIKPLWLRQLAKRFIRYQLAQKSLQTLCQYRSSIALFGKFLSEQPHSIQPEHINRALIMQYISYLHQLPFANEVINHRIMHIRLLFKIALAEEWLSINPPQLFYAHDRKPVKHLQPRYIPDSVLDQVNRHLIELPSDLRSFILLLKNTGRRVGELCALPPDCLITDHEGDYFLRYYEFKMKREHTIPINRETAAAIQEQQQFIKTQFNQPIYLFTKNNQTPIKSDTIRKTLHHLAEKYQIKGPDGMIWHFQPHQFRHTIGTKMINNGVPAHIVQRYLHHASPEMTMYYAHIHDQTLKTEFFKFEGKLVDIKGKIYQLGEQSVPSDLKWMKHNIMAQTLPNGYCSLPITQGNCPHANACLTCTHFRTDQRFLPQLNQQLEETDRLIHIAQKNQWLRQLQTNESVKQNLSIIINALDKENKDVAKV
jgi:site-specific recombinase XerD